VGQSKKGKKKRNRMCALCIVIILSCAIGISLWKIKNLETLAEIQSAGMYLFRGCGGVILSIDISSKFFKHKNIKQIYRFLIRHVAVWAVVLVMIFGSIITVSATGKIFTLKNQQSSGKEETSNVSKEEKEEKVKVVRNARAFSWTEDKYIQDLALYYDGEVGKLNEEERAECRAALLEEYENSKRETRMAPVESSYLQSYVQRIEEANIYYTYFLDAKVRDPYYFVQLDQLQKSKEKRIEANSYQKVSENMRLIGVNYIEEAGIPIVGQDEIAECYDKALMWFVSAYGQAIYELETGQCGTGTEQTEALRGQISDVYTYFSDGENEEKAVLARDMLKAIEAWEAIY